MTKVWAISLFIIFNIKFKYQWQKYIQPQAYPFFGIIKIVCYWIRSNNLVSPSFAIMRLMSLLHIQRLYLYGIMLLLLFLHLPSHALVYANLHMYSSHSFPFRNDWMYVFLYVCVYFSIAINCLWSIIQQHYNHSNK